MTEPATPSPVPDDAPTALDRARALIEPQLRLLGRLSEIGLDAAEAIGRQARGEATAAEGDLSLAYARVSRAVRLTVTLQSKLIEALAALEAGIVPGLKAAAARDADPILNADAEPVAEAEHETVREHDGREREAGDRFDDIDLVDLLDRPASEIVARIAADLGLPPSWSRMAEEAWAEAERTESDPGAPLMALLNTLETVRPAAPPGARRAPRGEPPDAVLDFRYRKRRRAPGVWESLEPMDAAEA